MKKYIWSEDPKKNWFYWKPQLITFKKAEQLLEFKSDYMSHKKHQYYYYFRYVFKGNYVDIGWWLANLNARTKLKQEIYDLYYIAKEKNIKESEIARKCFTNQYTNISLGVWKMLINQRVWNEEYSMKTLFKLPHNLLILRDILLEYKDQT